MRYMGGKFRQSAKIVEIIGKENGTNFKYCEPFAGAMWSAVAVIKKLKPAEVILSDINRPLMLLWCALMHGENVLPEYVSKKEHERYKKNQNMDDPLTAWYGHACSFGGKWFGSWARNNKGEELEEYNNKSKVENAIKTANIVKQANNLKVYVADYWDTIKDLVGWVLYLDPPYEGTGKGYSNTNKFDYVLFYSRVRQLSKFNKVYVTCFIHPEDFTVLYNWGDTICMNSADSVVSKNRKTKIEEKLITYTPKEIS